MLGDGVGFVDRLADGVTGVVSGPGGACTEPADTRLCDRLGLGSCAQDEGGGSGAKVAASVLNDRLESGLALVVDVFAAAAGLCDDAMHESESDLDFCNVAHFDGARCEVALASAMDGSEFVLGRARDEERSENDIAGGRC